MTENVSAVAYDPVLPKAFQIRQAALEDSRPYSILTRPPIYETTTKRAARCNGRRAFQF
jgi:hypothetical protein